jgi:hypothetical protein
LTAKCGQADEHKGHSPAASRVARRHDDGQARQQQAIDAVPRHHWKCVRAQGQRDKIESVAGYGRGASRDPTGPEPADRAEREPAPKPRHGDDVLAGPPDERHLQDRGQRRPDEDEIAVRHLAVGQPAGDRLEPAVVRRVESDPRKRKMRDERGDEPRQIGGAAKEEGPHQGRSRGRGG